jgi:nucleotide-binding universal stress UspA family protein
MVDFSQLLRVACPRDQPRFHVKPGIAFALTEIMVSIRRILCPVDFSAHSRRALDHAMAIASWYDAAVTVLHVSPPLPVAAYAPMSGMPPYVGLTPEGRQVLLRSMKEFAGSGLTHIPVEFEVAEGPPAGVIVASASELLADLVVLGTHGRSGFERWMLGSVTEKVLRKARCPVLTVPTHLAEPPTESTGFRRIVCASDFSECSLHAIEYAVSLAETAHAALTLMHVVELPPDIPREVHENVLAGPRNLRESIALLEDEGRARLKAAVPDHVRATLPVDVVLTSGKPYREILRVAGERNADLIVVGVHGRGAIDRLLFGSTTQHLVRQAECPVLTIRKDATDEGG